MTFFLQLLRQFGQFPVYIRDCRKIATDFSLDRLVLWKGNRGDKPCHLWLLYHLFSIPCPWWENLNWQKYAHAVCSARIWTPCFGLLDYNHSKAGKGWHSCPAVVWSWQECSSLLWGQLINNSWPKPELLYINPKRDQEMRKARTGLKQVNEKLSNI